MYSLLYVCNDLFFITAFSLLLTATIACTYEPIAGLKPPVSVEHKDQWDSPDSDH